MNSKNVGLYKEDPTSEIYGALGYQSEIKFEKSSGVNKHFLHLNFLLGMLLVV